MAYLDLGCPGGCGADPPAGGAPTNENYSSLLLPVIAGLGVYAAVRAFARPRVRRLAGTVGIISGVAVNTVQAYARADAAQADLFAASKAWLIAAAKTGDCPKALADIQQAASKGYLTRSQKDELAALATALGC